MALLIPHQGDAIDIAYEIYYATSTCTFEYAFCCKTLASCNYADEPCYLVLKLRVPKTLDVLRRFVEDTGADIATIRGYTGDENLTLPEFMAHLEGRNLPVDLRQRDKEYFKTPEDEGVKAYLADATHAWCNVFGGGVPYYGIKPSRSVLEYPERHVQDWQ